MNWDYFLFFFFYQNPFFSPKSRPVSYLRSSKCVFKLIIQCVNMSDHTVCVLNPSAAGDRITLERIFVVFFFFACLDWYTLDPCVCVEGMLNISRRRTLVQMSPELSADTAYPKPLQHCRLLTNHPLKANSPHVWKSVIMRAHRGVCFLLGYR